MQQYIEFIIKIIQRQSIDRLLFVILLGLTLFSCKEKDKSPVLFKDPIVMNGKNGDTLENDGETTTKKKLVNYSQNTETDLAYKELFSRKLSIKIPRSFERMSEEMIKIKYPNRDFSGVVVFTNYEATTNVVLNMSEKPMVESIEATIENFRYKLSAMQSLDIKKAEIIESAGLQIAVIKFDAQAIDTTIANVAFITEINEQAFTGSINYFKNEANTWAHICDEIVRSLQAI